jgi:hypothetical protein
MFILKSIVILTLSFVLAILIGSGGVSYGAMELASLIYIFIPFCVFLFTILLFFVLPRNIINKRNLMIILVATNILTGVLMRLDFYYNIFGF